MADNDIDYREDDERDARDCVRDAGGGRDAAPVIVDGRFVAPPPDPAAAAPRRGGRGYLAAKRAFDVAFSAAVCVVLAVPVALACAAIALDSPGGPVFRQERVG